MGHARPGERTASGHGWGGESGGVLTTEEDDRGDHADAEADSSGGAGAVVSSVGTLRGGWTYDFTTRSATVRPRRG